MSEVSPLQYTSEHTLSVHAFDPPTDRPTELYHDSPPIYLGHWSKVTGLLKPCPHWRQIAVPGDNLPPVWTRLNTTITPCMKTGYGRVQGPTDWPSWLTHCWFTTLRNVTQRHATQ